MTEDEHASPQPPPPQGAGDGGAAAAAHDEPRGGEGRAHGRGPGSGSAAEAGSGSGAEAAAGAGPQPERPDPAGPHAPRLTRSRRPRVAGGVCAGLGRYFDLDPVVFRVPLVVLSVVGGLGLIFYGFAWLLIPAEGEQQNEARWLLSGRVEGTTLSAILVALVGCGLFLASLGNSSTPFSLLIAGAVFGAAYWSRHRREAEAAEAVGAPVDPTTAHAVADAPPEAQAPPVPGMPSWWREPLTKDGSGDSGYLWGPADQGASSPARGFAGAAVRWRGERRGRPLGGLISMLASAAAVVGTFSEWESRPLGTSLTIGLACALAVYGLGLVVSAFAGRVGFGTVFMVVVTAVMLTGASLIPKSIGTDWRSVVWTPASAADVRSTYRLDAGMGELDLRNVQFSKGEKAVRTSAELGVGTLRVIVPSDVTVVLDARVGVGEVREYSESDPGGGSVVGRLSGFDRQQRATLAPVGGGAPAGTVELSVETEAGQLEIVRALPSGERPDGEAFTGPGRRAPVPAPEPVPERAPEPVP
ncbi:PspC domain-containing protein [Streptomyces ovatisporus]|uniref:PspC domain-containing protein n=1 Tax=Streptomyces ovatisporus TaxID=1128682 RepID=A0ABV9A116_9ACTN